MGMAVVTLKKGEGRLLKSGGMQMCIRDSTNMGISAIAAWLNQHGYKKKKRQNNTLDAFASSFIKGVLDNPVYCGKLAYG